VIASSVGEALTRFDAALGYYVGKTGSMFENFMIQVEAAWLLSHVIVCLISVISNTFPSTGVI
jgi:hypothetical protein